MGEVYRAEDGRLKRTVALKVLPAAVAEDADRLARFHREAETLAQLDHPNIVTIFSVDHVEEVRFLTMTWVDGPTLEAALPSEGLALDEFFGIAVPLTDALSAAHDKGITHRDLKPANVMLTGQGEVKVLDFGLAKSCDCLIDVDPDAETIVRQGNLIGSLPYMAPEQVRDLDVDSRTDVFSLGVMLYELATGQRPFAGASAGDLVSSILRDSPPPVDQARPELPRHLGRILQRALHKDPERRYQSAKGLRNALEDLRTEVSRQAPEIRTIAVLPFVDMSPERDQGYFCEGVAEEILGALASLQSLSVAARASSFQFREGALDVREIGTRLNVQAILDGSVRKAGQRLRINAQLINVADGYHLWSERYDRELEDVFAVQDEIAASVVAALKLTLSPREEEALKSSRAAELEAYDFYLRGRREIDRWTRGSLETALEMFTRSVEIDPDYAPGWAGISDAHAHLFSWFGACSDDLAEADRTSRRAVDLAPGSAEAHASRGLVLSLRNEDGATASFERALELNPSLYEAYWHFGRDEFRCGRLEHAVELLEKARDVRPEEYQASLLLPGFYCDLDQPEKAEAAERIGLERVRKRLELAPSDSRAYSLMTSVLFRHGEVDEAFVAAERALEISPDEPSTLYNIACFYATAGELDKAMDCLEKAHESNFGFRSWIEKDHDLDPLRDLPRFIELFSPAESAD